MAQKELKRKKKKKVPGGQGVYRKERHVLGEADKQYYFNLPFPTL